MAKRKKQSKVQKRGKLEPELSIPDFLKQSPADKKAADEIKAEIDTKKKAKTKARLEKMKRFTAASDAMPLAISAAVV